MKKLITSMVVAIALCTAVNVHALSQEEQAVVQKAANEYLSTVPDNGYHLSAEAVLERIKSGKKDFVLVDVRMPKDKKYAQGHVPGAIYIGFRELLKPENIAKLPKDMDIIVYCDTGHEQNKALSALRLLGYRAYDMKWGFSSWKVAGPTALTLGAIEGSISGNYPIEK